jgi:hypothetical protein
MSIVSLSSSKRVAARAVDESLQEPMNKKVRWNSQEETLNAQTAQDLEEDNEGTEEVTADASIEKARVSFVAMLASVLVIVPVGLSRCYMP